ncbi:MAG: asparaginase [Ruegeria sp.]
MNTALVSAQRYALDAIAGDGSIGWGNMAILLIHTGGTIGMVKTQAGFTPQDGVVEDFVQRLSTASAYPSRIDVHALTPLIDSANASPADWDRIAATIEKNHDRYQAFIVTHGTDTLAYTAGALCFALEGLKKPIILTGSMLPLTVESTDGAQNLGDALTAAETAPPGVWVQFAGKLLHGARVRKSHSRALDAFAADPSDIPPLQRGPALIRQAVGAHQVAVLAMAPGVPDGLLEHPAETLDGMVLRCYGSGTAPATAGLERALRICSDRRVPVVAVSQCPEGGMALGTYAAGAILRDNGVVDGRDMTVEAAYSKLNYVLSYSQSHDARVDRLAKSLCGEFTPEE